MQPEHTPRICSVERSHIGRLIEIADETRLSRWSANSYLEEMCNPDSVMYRLVSSENETIGFVVGRIIRPAELSPEAEIYNIAVVQREQGRGSGQQLLDAFLTAAGHHSARTIWLEVRESNVRAIRFYEKNGFRRVQTRPNFYDDPREAALLMRLELRGQKGC